MKPDELEIIINKAFENKQEVSENSENPEGGGEELQPIEA